ncbi:MAG: DMT family transporter [Alphaproteobacteria bacterium]|nr:DMT family transporter [Alphaproteobacteria bacterium]
MEQKGERPAAVFAAAMVAVVLFAVSGPLTRAITGDIDPLLLGMRPAAAALAAIPIVVALRLPGPRNRHEWMLLVVSALGSFLAFPLLFTLGQARTSATHGALIQAAMPIFTGLAAAVVERRRPGVFWWLGAALAFLGEGVLFALRGGASGGHEASPAGDLLVLAACALSASAYVAGARLAAHINALAATLWGVGFAGLILLPFAVARIPAVDWSRFGSGDLIAVAILAYGPNLSAFIAWYWALHMGGVQRVAVFQFAVPPLSVLIAIAFLGERLTPSLILALALVLGGIALARRRDLTRPRAAG